MVESYGNKEDGWKLQEQEEGWLEIWITRRMVGSYHNKKDGWKLG